VGRGVTVRSLAAALAEDEGALEQHLGTCADINANPFVALNTGFVRDGAYIHLARGATVDRPIHLLFVEMGGERPTVSHPRILVVAEDNVEATLVKSFAGRGGAHLSNVVTE